MNFKHLTTLLFMGISTYSAGIYASDSENHNLSVNGFLTQGFFYTDQNNLYGESSDNGSFDFHEIAVNSAYRFTPKLRGALQIMSRQAGNVDNGELKLDYALLDYRFNDSVEKAVGVRAGRLKIPFGFYNETRDVAFTRPSIMLPQSLYFDQARDLELSIDGVILYSSLEVPGGWLDLDLLYGSPQTDTNVEYAYFAFDAPGKLNDSDGVMGRAIYSVDGGRIRVGLTGSEYRLGYKPGNDPTLWNELNEGDLKLNVLALSGQYNAENWSLTGEYMLHELDWRELGGVFTLNPVTTIESYYLQLQYRFNYSWDLLLRYDDLKLDKDDPLGKQNSALLNNARPAHNFYAKDLTLGVGWRPAPKWLFRAELHNVEGTGWLAEQDNPDASVLRKYWNAFSLQATYRF
ncbi:Phosphate-selective porin [Amphritea atlantica]|uniref:Phosphate-selective porin n=1 Tax=Amphritea atlantica TaxID=355243 RepID=A0A1H9H6R7_9GAMM|nr:hypothetical protein [Amphritea atlantica]SEQ57937.1 Phosphate-selective porin [Amphritea atlantica]